MPEVILQRVKYLGELLAVDGRELCRTFLEDALGGSAHLLAQECHLLRHLLLLKLLLRTQLLLKRFAPVAHLLLLLLLHRLHLLPECLLLVTHLLLRRSAALPGSLHLRPHGKEDSQCSQSDADEEKYEIIDEFHSYCLMIVQCKDTNK